MCTDNKGNLIAVLTEVSITCKAGQIKVENSPNGLLLKIRDGNNKLWSLIYLSQEETQSLLGALNSVAMTRFKDDYRTILGLIEEKKCEIGNLKTLNDGLHASIKSKDDTIRELREIIKGQEEALDCMKNACEKCDAELVKYIELEGKLEDTIEACKDKIETDEGFFEKLKGEFSKLEKSVKGKDLRIDEYKKELEKAHTQIDILRRQKDSKPKKWKRKYKELKKSVKEEIKNFEMMVIGRDGTIAGKESLIKDLQTQKVDAQEKIKELQRHNDVLTKSEFVIYKGRQIESEFLREVAIERLNQFKKGRTIEKDVLNNRNGQLVQAAMYCVDNKKNTYPENWTTDFRESLKKKGRFPKLICSAALLIAHMDMKKYIYDQNRKFEKLQKGE
ncbi:Chromosome partition protein Smc [compost metagenome]